MKAPAESLNRLEALKRTPVFQESKFAGNRLVRVQWTDRLPKRYLADEWLVELSYGPVVLRETADDGWEACRVKKDHAARVYVVAGPWRYGETAGEALWNA